MPAQATYLCPNDWLVIHWIRCAKADFCSVNSIFFFSDSPNNRRNASITEKDVNFLEGRSV